MAHRPRPSWERVGEGSAGSGKVGFQRNLGYVTTDLQGAGSWAKVAFAFSKVQHKAAESPEEGHSSLFQGLVNGPRAVRFNNFSSVFCFPRHQGQHDWIRGGGLERAGHL